MQSDELEDMLADLRTAAPQPSDALMDRVLADALRHQGPAGQTAASPGPRPGRWSRLIAQFGGLPAVAGLCSAAVTGVIIGYVDPTTLDYLTGGAASDVIGEADLFPTSDFLATEG